MKKTKNFDYKVYELEKEIKKFILVFITFILSFCLGYWCKNKNYEETVTRQAIEIVDLKEQIHREVLKGEEQ